ncbi:MAG: dihydrolipoyl dehydrogenase [Sulfobacillus benefaciens]|uniref:Dihydrolipoyl dehydrogenase n=1 Tax=Sulfobacillus benefaciens TaxID=453960 RepID=A0A2T2XCA6_9FIRM|nr:MAG: dihydrolipoyl dehydrogenase [Sulfobacillus benefaciens]
MSVETLKFDVATIGGGPGATPGAEVLARHNKHVAIIEQGDGLGGTCLFEGCIPSKIFLETAHRIRLMQAGSQFGIVNPTYQGVDLPILRDRKRQILDIRVHGAQTACDRLGITVIKGQADFVDPHHLVVRTANEPDLLVEAEYILAAPGSSSRPLAIPGADSVGVWSSAEALQLSDIPESLCIIGGGYIGVELATLYHALGSRVHILEMAPRLLLTEDPIVAQHLMSAWTQAASPVVVETGVNISHIDEINGQWQVHYTGSQHQEVLLEVDRVLVAVGRVPNTQGLSWAKAGITLGSRGEVPVNEYYQTIVPHVYAPGDANGQMMLAHAATRQSQIAAQHILGVQTFATTMTVPHVIFSHPEIAAVGADSRALAEHPNWKLTTWPYRQDARALIVGDASGFAQIIWDEDTHQIKGLQIIGDGAGELVDELTDVIAHGGTLETVVETIHPHPTMNEVVSELVAAAWEEAQNATGTPH